MHSCIGSHIAINRRKFLSLLSGFASAPTFTACTTNARGSSNVLFIAVDDLNDWIGCLGGHPDARTPNIDYLASRGVLFSNAHCSVPWCNPERNSILTGVSPLISGIYHQEKLRDRLPNAVTLPQQFLHHGYDVIGAGKIFHDAFDGRQGDPQSWHRYFSRTGIQQRRVPALNGMRGLSDTDYLDWGEIDLPAAEMGDWQTVDWAINELQKTRFKPLFLGVGFRLPHLPWYLPTEYFSRFSPEHIQLPTVAEHNLQGIPAAGVAIAKDHPFASQGTDHERIIASGLWPHATAAYLSAVSFLDDMVGRLLDAFERSRYADNSIIVFWSDGGFHLGEKAHWRKFTLWEDGTHSPLIITGSGIRSGVCTQAVSLLDIYPTLMELCGIEISNYLSGRSLSPSLHDPDLPTDSDALTVYHKTNFALRTRRWRYIRYSDGSEELYNHEKDPHEWYNLASNAENSHIKHHLSKRMDAKIEWLMTRGHSQSPTDSAVSGPNLSTRLEEVQEE